MENQNSFIRVKDIKTPVALFYVAVYVSALVIELLRDPRNAMIFTGLSIGLLLLCWLIIDITPKVKAPDIEITRPGWELAFGLLILVAWRFVPLPELEFGDRWNLGFILRKNLIIVVLPFVFLKLRKNSLLSMGLTTTSWKRNLGVGLIVFAAMAIPSALFISDTGSLVLSGKVSLAQIALGLPASFTYYLLMSGFSEEFFFRAFIQTRFSIVLKSKIDGILITALLFGLIHIPGIMRWYPGTTLLEAFSRAFFVQTFTGLIFGVLWGRTRNLIPCAFLHAGLNGLNNLGSIISQLGL